VSTDASTFADSNQTLLDADGREFGADSGTIRPPLVALID
jgi:hypothetical protein